MRRYESKQGSSPRKRNLIIKKNKEIKKLKKELYSLRKHFSKDFRTNTLNKGTGIRRLQIEINRSHINHTPTTIAFIDVDNMKAVNDNFGHCVGDELLLNLGTIISENIRKGDFVFRFGGDEFVIVFSSADKIQSKMILERIEKEIENFNKSKKNLYEISISHGISEYKGDEKMKVYSLLDSADVKMYKNKRLKKSR